MSPLSVALRATPLPPFRVERTEPGWTPVLSTTKWGRGAERSEAERGQHYL